MERVVDIDIADADIVYKRRTFFRIFDIFDQDCDGVITVPEFGRALDRLGLGVDSGDLASLLSSFIRSDRRGLDFEDFELLCHKLGDSTDLFAGAGGGDVSVAEQEESEMVEAFRVFDEDDDGFISTKELHRVLERLGMEVSMANVEDIVISVDTNCDGRVDFGEFKVMMLGVP